MKRVLLNDVAEIVAGQSPPSKTYNQNGQGLPFYQGKADFGEKHPKTRFWCSEPQKIALPGDILISVRAPVGPTNRNIEKSCIGRGLSAIRCYPQLSADYLIQFLKSYETKLADKASGSTFTAITQKDLKKLQIPLPPLPIQKQIAEALDTANHIRQRNKQVLEKYDQLAQSVFLEMFGDPVKNEKGWEVKKLGEISKISSGSTPSRVDDSYFQGSIPWVKTGEVDGSLIMETSENISEDALKNSSCRIYPKGSILIAMYGQGKTRGKVGVLGIDATTNQACAVIPPSELMNFSFLFSQLKMRYEDLREMGRGGNQPNLNVGMLKAYEVIHPPLNLQNQFAAIIEKIEQQKQQAQAELEKSEELFGSLLQRAFNGILFK